jgi:Holliday junction resolvase-like predicted endonuclease
MKFNETNKFKKGTIGENIIVKELESNGWSVYRPNGDKAHLIDIIAIKNNKTIAVDVKTKARFNKFNAQGIDLKHYKKYKQYMIENNHEVYVFFIDDKIGDIHILDLKNEPNGIVFAEKKFPYSVIKRWNLEDLIFFKNINNKQAIDKLSNYDERNYEFSPQMTFNFN